MISEEEAKRVDRTKRAMAISGDVIGESKSFKYLGSFVQMDGGFGMDVKYRIKCGWMKWREAFGVLCDKRIPMTLKVKFYRSVMRPTMLYRIWSGLLGG